MATQDIKGSVGYADLEVSLYRRGEGGYAAGLLLRLPGDAADISPLREAVNLSALDGIALLESALDSDAYGRYLTSWFFADPHFREGFLSARRTAGDALRVRLIVGPGAPELHALRWETLRDPEFDEPLFSGERTVLSRFLPSLDWRPVRLQPRARLRALVAVADPVDLTKFGLSRVSVPRYISQVRQALADMDVVSLVRAEDGGTVVSLENVVTRLREGFDLLYLVAHGRLVQGSPVLYLEDGTGNAKRVPGRSLVKELAGLDKSPALAVLASCESGGSGDEADTLAALGPLLAERCVPAVLAMQGAVTMTTVERFMPVFFGELRRDGRIDRAAAAARSAVGDRLDWWMPALFMRLREGRLWQDPKTQRDLSREDILAGLDRLERYLPQYAPEATALRARVTRHAGALRASPAALGQQPDRAAFAAIEQVCAEVLELDFADLANGRDPAPLPASSPFLGLAAFKAEHRRYFFGRDSLVRTLCARLAEHSFLAVLGPSGSGKSSLVLAGVVPTLQDRDQSVRVVIMTPGTDPIGSLGAAAARVTAPSMLVVDQFEEIFTLCADDGARRAFFDRLLALTDRLRVVLTMRADFWGDCAIYEDLRARMQMHQELIAPLGAEELGLAINQQASVAGLHMEPDLVNLIVDDVTGEPGAMPLVQHALHELWKRRHGRWLRTEEYRALGGVQQAIAFTADGFYGQLTSVDQERLRAILSRLTRVDDDPTAGERRDTRQRVAMAELAPSAEQLEPIRQLVSRLAGAEARLVVTSRRPSPDGDQGIVEVEIAHEALIRFWPRLRDWIEADRGMLRTRDAVRRAAHEWVEHGEDESYLTHQGRRLDEVRTLLDHPRAALAAQERAYLVACEEREQRLSRLAVSITVATPSAQSNSRVSSPDDDEGQALEFYVGLPGGQPNFVLAADRERAQADIELDMPGLRELKGDSYAYGKLLTEQVLGAPPVAEMIRRAYSEGVPSAGRQSHWWIDPSAPSLHEVRWETLHGPDEAGSVASDRIYTSCRLVESSDAKLLPITSHRAVVAVAGSATDAALSERVVTSLVSFNPAAMPLGQVSLENLANILAAPVDVLYLATAVRLLRGEPYLTLNGSTGGAIEIRWADLGAKLAPCRPRLIALAGLPGSKGSASDGDSGALANLAARLVESGVLAVVVFPMAHDPAAQSLLELFSRELLRDGRPFRALRVAAGALAAAPSLRSRPMLYLADPSAGVWYEPGLQGADGNVFRAVHGELADLSMVPILGPGLTDGYFGTQHELARALSAGYLEMGPSASTDLTEVLQLVATRQSLVAARHRFLGESARQLAIRFQTLLPQGFVPDATMLSGADRQAFIEAALDARTQLDPREPHMALARLQAPLYVTTNPDDLLTFALRKQGREPVVDIARWRRFRPETMSMFRRDREYVPTVERPLVFHLFGNARAPESMVLTEDDMFALLTALANQRTSVSEEGVIPMYVAAQLASCGLAFIGHRLDERSFQFLSRIVMDLLVIPADAGLDRARIIQLEPSIGSAARRQRLSNERRFQLLHRMSVYSGRVEDFLSDLALACARAGAVGLSSSAEQPTAAPGVMLGVTGMGSEREPRGPEEGRSPARAPLGLDGGIGSHPYAGPRAYTYGEALFGRRREVAELENILISQRVVLIYAPSGAGKTSLIRAGLIPSLERRQLFRILPILRVGLASDDGRATAANPYVLSTLRCIEAGLNTAEQLPPNELSKFTIAEYLERRAPQAADARKPELLIFDQFEEIFSDPVNRDAKAEFFGQLGEALGSRDDSEGGRPAHLRRCLISMREDQIAKLDDFRAMIPGGLANTFRLNLLKRAQAREAIMGPAEKAGLAIDYEVVDRLVDELSRVHGADREASVPGDFVEPMFLQLVCSRMWSRAVASGKRRISVADAEAGTFASPEVDRILADFYDETLREIERETGASERAMRDWFEGSLITRSRVRTQVSLEDPRNAFITERAIYALNGRLLRTESRAGALWIELSHDRLVDPILTSNAAWREAHLAPLQRQADLWNEAGRSADLLFSGDTLDRAEEQAKQLDLTESDRAFLAASRSAEKRRWLGFLRGG